MTKRRISKRVVFTFIESLEDDFDVVYNGEHAKVVNNTHPDTCQAGHQVKRRMTLDQLDNM